MHKIMEKLARDNRGQDMIEYALAVGFVCVAIGAIMPGVAAQLSRWTTADFGTEMVRIICAVLAALFLALIMMRRKQGTEEE